MAIYIYTCSTNLCGPSDKHGFITCWLSLLNIQEGCPSAGSSSCKPVQVCNLESKHPTYQFDQIDYTNTPKTYLLPCLRVGAVDKSHHKRLSLYPLLCPYSKSKHHPSHPLSKYAHGHGSWLWQFELAHPCPEPHNFPGYTNT